MKVKQKEAITTIQTLIMDGQMKGEFDAISNWGIQNSTDPVVELITSKLNAKQCPKGITTGDYNHDWGNRGLEDSWNNHSARWVLPTGAQITLNGVNSGRIIVFIDGTPGGPSDVNKVGGDQIEIQCNPKSNGTVTTYNGVEIRAGSCVPFRSPHVSTYRALY